MENGACPIFMASNRTLEESFEHEPKPVKPSKNQVLLKFHFLKVLFFFTSAVNGIPAEKLASDARLEQSLRVPLVMQH